MPLDGSLTNYPRLDEATWLPQILAYTAGRARQAEAEAAARAAKAQNDALRQLIMAQMKGSPVALCGHRVLTHSTVAGLPRNIKLHDSRTFSFDNLRALILPDGSNVLPHAVASVFGGRSGYDKLEVK